MEDKNGLNKLDQFVETEMRRLREGGDGIGLEKYCGFVPDYTQPVPEVLYWGPSTASKDTKSSSPPPPAGASSEGTPE